jgi:hypothetical protein
MSNNLFGNLSNNVKTGNQTGTLNNIFGNNNITGNNNTNPLFGKPQTDTSNTNNLFGFSSNTNSNTTQFGINNNQTNKNNDNKNNPIQSNNLFPFTNPNNINTTSNNILGNNTSNNQTTNNNQTQVPSFGISNPSNNIINTSNNQNPLNKEPNNPTNIPSNSEANKKVSTTENNNIINTTTNQNEQNKINDDKNKLNIKSPEPPQNDLNQLDQMTISALEKKTIEETVNSWSNTLEQQQSKMGQLTEKFQNLDLQLNSCFDSVKEIIAYRENLQNNSNSILNKLKDINENGNQMISQLEFMHRELKRTLINCNKLPQGDDKDEQFYNNINIISDKVNDIGNEIEEMNDKMQDKGNNNFFNKKNEYGYDFDDQDSNDKLYVDDNEMNEILNSFYISIMSIRNMEQDLNNRLKKVQQEINDKKNDNNSNYYSYNNN